MPAVWAYVESARFLTAGMPELQESEVVDGIMSVSRRANVIMSDDDLTPAEQIKKNNDRRHKHDEIDRCHACGAFIPSDGERVICPNCGKPHFRYRG